MMAREAQESPACEATGDRSGQRSGDVESADAVRQAVGGVRGPVRSGDRVGVLSALSQQVQSDRALLGDLGDALERGGYCWRIPLGGRSARTWTGWGNREAKIP